MTFSTISELGQAIDSIQAEAFRLEPRQSYAGVQDPGWEAWKAGLPLPHRSPDNDRWLARVARHAAAGRRVYRVLVVDWPLHPYKHYELEAFRLHVPAGEGIYVVDRGAHPALSGLADDFWMLDERQVAVLRFDQDDRAIGPADPDYPVAVYRACRDLVVALAAPLEEWLASHRDRMPARRERLPA